MATRYRKFFGKIAAGAAATAIGVPITAVGAAPVKRPVYYQSSFVVPYAPPAAAAAPNFGWHGPLAGAPPVAKAQQGYSSVPYNTAQLSVNFTNFGWHGPTSTAPPVARAQAGNSFVPFDTRQLSVNFTNFGWHGPTSTAPPVARAQAGNSFVPFNTAQVASNYTNYGWYQALSTPPPVAKARQGDSFVPFDTAQITAASGIPLDMGGAATWLRQVYYQSNFVAPYVAPVVVAAYTNFWLQPLSTAAPVARAVSDFGSVALFTPAAVTGAWQQPLSVAVAVAKVRQGESFVPYNTAQLAVNYTDFDWYNPLSDAPPVASARLSDWSLPYTIVGATGVAWQQPLSITLSDTKAQQGFADVPLSPTQQVVVGWQQPLAIATVSAKAQQGLASTVFYTASPVAGIAGIAWFTPLWTVPTRLLAAQQGDSFVPFNTAQTVVTATGRRKPLLFISNVGRLMN